MKLEHLRYDEELKFFHRGDSEIFVHNEQKSYGKLGDMKGKKILDVGGHIGWFTKFCLDLGADSVVAIEPDPVTAGIYRMNHKGMLYEGAVVSDGRESLTLQLSHTYPSNNRSDREVRGRDGVEVKCYDFQTLINEHKPDIIKVDIEGAEYGLNWDIPDFVTAIAIEYHQFDPQMLEQQRKLHSSLLAQGFDAVVQPKDKITFQKITTGVYRR